ncbi:MAG TPA: DUF1428 domain-containing protein [Sphingomicrobium sp.]|nr:DUF1428 domain-containing protein [Sphingomicrobium sp.]
MTYFEGFVVPVPEANKDAFAEHAKGLTPAFLQVGVRRQVEAWESDVPQGKVTDFRKAVAATPDEKAVIAWFEYPDRKARDAANEGMMSNADMAEQARKGSPFDAKRMILGGFDAIVEEGPGGGGYVDGFVVPVQEGKREAYRELASKMAKSFRKHGATRIVEAIADDVPHGEVTDFYRAVKAEDGETVVFSFIEWPDKAVRDEAWNKIMADESMKPEGDMPFNGQRMFWGGFEKVVDTANPELVAAAAAPVSA